MATLAIERLMLIAHAGHWLVSVSYFIPIIGFVIWLAVVQIRERRRRDEPDG